MSNTWVYSLLVDDNFKNRATTTIGSRANSTNIGSPSSYFAPSTGAPWIDSNGNVYANTNGSGVTINGQGGFPGIGTALLRPEVVSNGRMRLWFTFSGAHANVNVVARGIQNLFSGYNALLLDALYYQVSSLTKTAFTIDLSPGTSYIYEVSVLNDPASSGTATITQNVYTDPGNGSVPTTPIDTSSYTDSGVIATESGLWGFNSYGINWSTTISRVTLESASVSTGSSTSVTSVSISPSSASVTGGLTQQFTATVQGTNAPSGIVWSASFGTINASGVFTAPAALQNPQTGTVTAISVYDSTKSASALIYIPANIIPITSVSLFPNTATVSGNQTQQFTATVSPSGASQSVSWFANSGSITSGGLFTAPAAKTYAQNVIVTVLASDSTHFATGSVTVPLSNTLVFGGIGDSIMVGQGAGTGSEWFTRFISFLNSVGLSAVGVNRAVGGTAISDWVSGSTNLNNAIAAFISNGVTDVLIDLGVNDSKYTVKTSAANYASNLNSIINAIKSQIPGCKFWINSPTWVDIIQSTATYGAPSSTNGTWDTTSIDLLSQYTSIVLGLNNPSSNIYTNYNAFQEFFGSIGLKKDGVHPTGFGHYLLAVESVKAYLNTAHPTYIFNYPVRPVLNITGGVVNSGTSIVPSYTGDPATSGYVVSYAYTNDGTVPVAGVSTVANSVPVTSKQTLTFIPIQLSLQSGFPVTGSYVLTLLSSSSVLNVVASSSSKTISLSGGIGSYSGSVSGVGGTISVSGNIATYMPPANPNSSGTDIITLYSGAQTLNITVNISAEGFTMTPVISLPSGTIALGTSINFTSSTSGAVFYYTTDGRTPTTSSNTGNSLVLNTTGNITVKVIAVAPGYQNSVISSVNYFVAPPVSSVTISSTNLAIASNGTQQFTETCNPSGSLQTGTWYTSLGSITQNGVLTAPTNSSTFTTLNGTVSFVSTNNVSGSIAFTVPPVVLSPITASVTSINTSTNSNSQSILLSGGNTSYTATLSGSIGIVSVTGNVLVFTPASNVQSTTTGTINIYSGNVSLSIPVTVNPLPDFTISETNSGTRGQLSIYQGASASATLNFSSINNNNNPIALSVSSLPQNVTVIFNPNTPLSPGTLTTNLTFTIGNSAPTGTYSLTITGTDGLNVHTAVITLIILYSAPTVSFVSLSADTTTVVGGTSKTITANVIGNFNPSQLVTWFVDIGSISSGGVYTAPAMEELAQIVHVTATSVLDPTKHGTLVLTIPGNAFPASNITYPEIPIDFVNSPGSPLIWNWWIGDFLPSLKIKIMYNTTAVDLTGVSAYVAISPPSVRGLITYHSLTITNAQRGLAEWDFSSLDVYNLTPGVYNMSFVFTLADGRKFTLPRNGYAVFVVNAPLS